MSFDPIFIELYSMRERKIFRAMSAKTFIGIFLILHDSLSAEKGGGDKLNSNKNEITNYKSGYRKC